MEIEYKGANCVTIKSKNAVIVTDPTSNSSTRELSNQDAVVLATQSKFAPAEDQVSAFIIDMPGEYEHKDISARGIPVPAHLRSEDRSQDSTLYRVVMNGVKIAVVGHTVAPIDDDDLENLGVIDVVIIPVGGNGYTLDGRDAATIVRQISPKVVIPTHYDDGQTKYEVTQDSLDDFVKEMGGSLEKKQALKIKSLSDLPDTTTVYELDRTK